MPPVAITGLTAAICTYSVKTIVGLLTTATKGCAITVKLNVLLLVCNKLSVAVTVKFVGDEIDTGVPVILPSLLENCNPVGKLGLIVKTSVPSPPVPVTGKTGAIVSFTVNSTDAVFNVVLTGGGSITVNENTAELEEPTLSVTVIVNSVADNNEFGLPLMNPVLTFSAIVAGSAGLIL